jgi:hypothetical protein
MTVGLLRSKALVWGTAIEQHILVHGRINNHAMRRSRKFDSDESFFLDQKCDQQEKRVVKTLDPSTDLEHGFGSGINDALSSLLHFVKETHFVDGWIGNECRLRYVQV